MNPLLYLLGQQAAPEAAQGNIDVVGNRGRQYSAEDSDNVGVRLLGNTPAVESANEANQRAQQASDRRGAFGMKGTLRDVIGILGDAFLVQSGNAPIYGPTRRRERLGDAMAGFTEGTEEAMAAAERAANLGEIDAATGLVTHSENAEIKKLQAQSIAEGRQSQIEQRLAENLGKGRLAAQAVLAQPGAVNESGISPAAQNILGLIARQHGVTMEDLIGDGLSAEEASLYGNAGMTVNQQRNLPIAQQRADASTTSAQASMIRAQRPPQGRAPRAESDREAAIRIGNKPASERTPGEQAFYEKYTRPPAGAKKGPRAFPSTSPATSRFRPATRQ